jgi:predicted transcriptional regulator
MGLPERMAGRRDELTIMTDLIANMLQPMRSTHLLYRTNLSYSQLKKYLSSLQKMGFIQESQKPPRVYMVTEKGRTFLDLFDGEYGHSTGIGTSPKTPRN